MLNGTPNEPCCPHCLFGPCIIRRPPVFLTERAVPSLPAILEAFERPGVVGPPNIPGEEGIGDAPIGQKRDNAKMCTKCE